MQMRELGKSGQEVSALTRLGAKERYPEGAAAPRPPSRWTPAAP